MSGKTISLGQRAFGATWTHTDLFGALLDVMSGANVSLYKILSARFLALYEFSEHWGLRCDAIESLSAESTALT